MCLDNVMNYLPSPIRQLINQRQVEMQPLDPPDLLVSELLRSLRGQPVMKCVFITQEGTKRPGLEFIIALPYIMRSRLTVMKIREEVRKNEQEMAPPRSMAVRRAPEQRGESLSSRSTIRIERDRPQWVPHRCSLTFSEDGGDPLAIYVNGEATDMEEFVRQLSGPGTHDAIGGNLLNMVVEHVIASPEDSDTMANEMLWYGPMQLLLKWQEKSIVLGNPGDKGWLYVRAANSLAHRPAPPHQVISIKEPFLDGK